MPPTLSTGPGLSHHHRPRVLRQTCLAIQRLPWSKTLDARRAPSSSSASSSASLCAPSRSVPQATHTFHQPPAIRPPGVTLHSVQLNATMAVEWTWPNILWLSGLVTAGLQLLTFLIAYFLQFDKLTDISGTSNFVLLGWLSYALGGHHYTRQTVNTLLLTVWGVRLGSYLLLRVVRRGHDARFDEMRANFAQFGGFFVFQAFWVFLVTLPLLLSNATRYDVPIGARDYVGWALWTVGFLVEVWADQSKDAFYEQRRPSSSTSSSTRGIITTGCWSWSRHPK